mmetsp:Transcript_4481/g.14873  ORF Transcript_4481/g.14873 Transcript_4481/m.14873 type:complete len:255 (+) Transcript_4481:261-1025(+)
MGPRQRLCRAVSAGLTAGGCARRGVKAETFELYVDVWSCLCASAAGPTTRHLSPAIVMKCWAAAASAGRAREVVVVVFTEAFLMDFLVDFCTGGDVDLAGPPAGPARRRWRRGPGGHARRAKSAGRPPEGCAECRGNSRRSCRTSTSGAPCSSAAGALRRRRSWSAVVSKWWRRARRALDGRGASLEFSRSTGTRRRLDLEATARRRRPGGSLGWSFRHPGAALARRRRRRRRVAPGGPLEWSPRRRPGRGRRC